MDPFLIFYKDRCNCYQKRLRFGKFSLNFPDKQWLNADLIGNDSGSTRNSR